MDLIPKINVHCVKENKKVYIKKKNDILNIERKGVKIKIKGKYSKIRVNWKKKSKENCKENPVFDDWLILPYFKWIIPKKIFPDNTWLYMKNQSCELFWYVC